MRVFHLATDLGPTATGRRLSLLVPALTKRGVEGTVAVLDPRAVFSLSHTPLRMRPWFDLAGWRRLRHAIRDYQPDVIHAWGRRAAAVLNVVKTHCRVLKTFDGTDTYTTSRVGTRLAVPPIVPPQPKYDRDRIRAELGFTAADHVIVTMDRFEKPEAVKAALGILDVLKYTSPHWKLIVVGDGPAKPLVERFGTRLGADDVRHRFFGRVLSMPPLLAAVDTAWMTRSQGGVHFALEALAAGLPTLTLPNLDLAMLPNLILSATGVALATATRQALDHPQPRRDLTEGRYAVEPVVEQLIAAYQSKPV